MIFYFIITYILKLTKHYKKSVAAWQTALKLSGLKQTVFFFFFFFCSKLCFTMLGTLAGIKWETGIVGWSQWDNMCGTLAVNVDTVSCLSSSHFMFPAWATPENGGFWVPKKYVPSSRPLRSPCLVHVPNVPLAKANHMMRPILNVGGDHTKVWISGGMIHLWALV